MKHTIVLSLFVLLLSGCWVEENGAPVDNEGIHQGVKPVYISEQGWNEIKLSEPLLIEKLGKIYVYNNFLFVNELNKGIHIIDNTDPSDPVFVRFVAIPGNKDIAIKGNIMYVDNLTDLVALNIADFDDIKEVNRVENIYPNALLEYPPLYRGFFECVDRSKGLVVGWEEAELVNPDCWR